MSEPTDEERTVEFMRRYASALGRMESPGDPKRLRETLGPAVKMYRYQLPGRQFAITRDEAAKNALQAAGATQSTMFKMHSADKEPCWDVSLPPFLWPFI
jgi:hypothetical protein